MSSRAAQRSAPWLVLSLAALGCASVGYVKDPAPWVAAADWPKAQRVAVVMREHFFQPQVLTFEEGRPYVLEIRNEGREKHYFVSELFFRAVATRKAEVPGAAEVKAPHFTALEVYPGHTLELLFVAVRPGVYDLACTVAGHAGKGMTGALRITPKPKAPGK